MSQETRATLAAYFLTGSIPTEAEFANLIESSPNIVDDGVTLSGESGVTAHAGGGQANAVVLSKKYTGITVVAAGGDSIKFPTGVCGMTMVLINAGANACDLFPAVGEQIMALGVNTAQSIAVGEVWYFGFCSSYWIGGKLT